MFVCDSGRIWKWTSWEVADIVQRINSWSIIQIFNLEIKNSVTHFQWWHMSITDHSTAPTTFSYSAVKDVYMYISIIYTFLKKRTSQHRYTTKWTTLKCYTLKLPTNTYSTGLFKNRAQASSKYLCCVFKLPTRLLRASLAFAYKHSQISSNATNKTKENKCDHWVLLTCLSL